jgi:hypothetical protein
MKATDKIESLLSSVTDERSGENGYAFRGGDVALLGVHQVWNRHDGG